MAVAAAEQFETEVYAHSLSTLRRLGGFVVAGCTNQERITTQSAAYDDFEKAVAEMLKTDKEFRGSLDIDNERSHQVSGGFTRSVDGIAMVEMLEEGVKSSKRRQEKQSGFCFQVNRDECDVEVAKVVDKLRPGQTWLGLSFWPKKAMEVHPEMYKDELGYREGLVYIQTYSKLDEHSLFAGSYSVDLGDSETWRAVFAEYGIDVPPTVSDDNWLRYGVEITASPEEAKALARQMRSRYYEHLGWGAERISVNHYVEQNGELVSNLFTAYYPAIAEAVYTGLNNPILRNFAGSVLSMDISKLDPEVRKQLIIIANSSKVSDESARILDSVLRYTVVEELRKSLAQYISADMTGQLWQRPVLLSDLKDLGSLVSTTNRILANNLQIGIAAGRDYGGCAGQIKLSTNPTEDGLLTPSLQEAFGGKGREDQDRLGSRKFICSNGHVNKRPENDTIDTCQHRGCKAVVSCKK